MFVKLLMKYCFQFCYDVVCLSVCLFVLGSFFGCFFSFYLYNLLFSPSGCFMLHKIHTTYDKKTQRKSNEREVHIKQKRNKHCDLCILLSTHFVL